MKTTKFISFLFILVTSITFSSCNKGNVAESLTGNVTNAVAPKKNFKKTKHSCHTCSCSGYWGYQHGNGTWEGACQNTDNWGHTCNHSPEAHGLRSW